MVKKSYEDDAFGNRKEFGDILYAFLQSEYILADESFVVALTGGFGSGKSHFLSMWETEIRAYADPKPLVVHVNAWESDHSGEPVLALVSAISKQLEESQKFSFKAVKNLKSAAAGVVLGSLSIAKELANGYIEEKTGVTPEKIIDDIGEGTSQKNLNRAAKKLFNDFDARQSAIGNLTGALRELIQDSEEGANLKLIVVVDELDRCRPTYAIDMLEALKHLFNVKGLAVVLAVDWEQLSCTAEALFGTGLNTTEYFRKFVTRKVSLPVPREEEMRKLVKRFWEKFVSSSEFDKKTRKSLAPSWDAYEIVPAAILFGLGVNRPRQVEDFFRIFSHLCHLKKDGTNRGRGIERNFCSILFLVGLHTTNPKIFTKIAAGELTVDEAIDIVFRITRRNSNLYQRELHFIESQILNDFTCDENSSELEKLFNSRTSLEEIDFRKRNRTLPRFSTGFEISEMTELAGHINSLKSFSER